jgi:hypothetical protein
MEENNAEIVFEVLSRKVLTLINCVTDRVGFNFGIPEAAS